MTPCPIDCVGEYTSFTTCQAVEKCGSTAGKQSRVFNVKTHAQFGGVECPIKDKTEEIADCKVDLVKCPPIHCEGHFEPPSQCFQVKCDDKKGFNTERFVITTEPKYEGKNCDYANGELKKNECTIEDSKLERCPIDCKGTWSEPTSCIALEECGCDSGTQNSTFHVDVIAEFGGKLCDQAHGTVRHLPCKVDAKSVKRCPNDLLDAPCHDLRAIIEESKQSRCALEAIINAVSRKHLPPPPPQAY